MLAAEMCQRLGWQRGCLWNPIVDHGEDVTPGAVRLRKACEGYAPAMVDRAVRQAIVGSCASDGESAVLAALVVHWLTDDGAPPYPPISDDVVDAVRRALRGGTR